MKIDWQVVTRILLGVLLSVMGFIGGRTLVQLSEIQKDLTTIKLELVKVQASMLDRESVRIIVRDELYERGVK